MKKYKDRLIGFSDLSPKRALQPRMKGTLKKQHLVSVTSVLSARCNEKVEPIAFLINSFSDLSPKRALQQCQKHNSINHEKVSVTSVLSARCNREKLLMVYGIDVSVTSVLSARCNL